MSKSMKIDYESLVSQADIYYSAPAWENYKGMPLGNGVTGSIVWMELDRLNFVIWCPVGVNSNMWVFLP